MDAPEVVIEARHLAAIINNERILDDITFDVYRDEVFGIVGESGCGKTTLLRLLLLLLRPSQGSLRIFHQNVLNKGEKELIAIQRRWGVLFQHSALFSSLNVLENVLFPLRTQTKLDETLQREIAYLKIALAGLPMSAAKKFPSELSGGMQKRAALARAMALDPEILFLDEPTSGLDPHSATQLDQLILDLRKSLNLTIIVVTHDLDTLWTVTDRVAFLSGGRILANLPMPELFKSKEPEIEQYFRGTRGQRLAELPGEAKEEKGRE